MWLVYIKTHHGVAIQKWMEDPAIGSRTEVPLQKQKLTGNDVNLGLAELQRKYPYVAKEEVEDVPNYYT